MEELICKECKGRQFRKISPTEYECEYCGAVIKETPQPMAPQPAVQKVVIVQQPMQPQVIETPFTPEISYSAGFKDGTFSWVSGKLIIYPEKFVFVPGANNPFYTGNLSPREWKITNIVGYVKGMLSFLDIKMKGGSKVQISVNGKKTIINALEERRKFCLEK